LSYQLTRRRLLDGIEIVTGWYAVSMFAFALAEKLAEG
jgi:hypothetical protein